MDRETPWREAPPPGPDGERLKSVLEDARRVEPWTASARALGWWRIAEAASVPRRRSRPLAWALAGTAFVAVASVTVAVLLPPSPPPAEAGETARWAAERLLPEGDLLKVSPGASYSVDHEQRVRLASGQLEADIAHRPSGDRFVVVTPHVTVTVVGTRFLVEVERDFSRVWVHEGIVRVRGGSDAEVTLHRGEEIRSDDPRLNVLAEVAPPQEEMVAPPVAVRVALPSTRCDGEGAVAARVACLEKLSKGTGLSAQTALFALALTESTQGGDARPHWLEYQTRFPDGVFAPEVSLSLMSANYLKGNRGQAVKEAESFLSRFHDDVRATQVATWRDALLDAMKLSAGSGQEGP